MIRSTFASLLLLVLVCSIFISVEARHVRKSKKIIKGSDAIPHEFPHQVVFLDAGDEPYCGGSIIDEHHILTAGHCIRDYKVRGTTIVAGAHSYKAYAGTGQKRKITDFENFRPADPNEDDEDNKFNNDLVMDDIGIVYVKDGFKFDAYVKPIGIPTDNEYPSGTVIASGWGLTVPNDEDSAPEILQKAELQIRPFEECKKSHGLIIFPPTDFCAAVEDYTTDICDGDSGGPVIQRANGKDTLIGINSFTGPPCARYNRPAAFVRVSEYLDWIKEVKEQIRERQNSKSRTKSKKNFVKKELGSEEIVSLEEVMPMKEQNEEVLTDMMTKLYEIFKATRNGSRKKYLN